MSGVFLSYSRGDRALADQIIRGLRALGVAVWWDEDMPGVNWQQELERQIKDLSAVVVVWTEHSANSNNVRDEARLGLNTDKLVNVMAGVTEPPFPFDRVNGLPLNDWNGRDPHKGWTRLVQTIEAHIVRVGGAQPGEITGALARRERAVREGQQAVAQATDAFRDAQTRDAEAGEAAKAAAEIVLRAEEQHQRVVEMRASPAVQRTAQQELDDARTARDEAERAQRSARAELSEASRGLSRANAELERLFADSAEPPAEAAPPPRAAPPAVDPPASRPAPVAASSAPQATPAPASAPKPAPRRAPALAKTPAVLVPGGSGQRWVAAAGIVAAAGAGAFLLLHHGGAAAPSAAQASAVRAASPAPPDPTAAAVRAAGALAGNWKQSGVGGCPGPYTISVANGALLFAASAQTSTSTIDPSPQPDAINVHDADGRYIYRLAADKTLSVVGPSGPIMRLTRCAG